MKLISFERHRFPADVIRHAVWLYFRFSLSFRDVEALLTQRGIDVSSETIRCWTISFGPMIARRLKQRRSAPSPRWHLGEVVCRIGGKRMFLWRAVDDEGEILDVMVQRGGTQRRQPSCSSAGRAREHHNGRTGVLRGGPRSPQAEAHPSAGAAPREQSD